MCFGSRLHRLGGGSDGSQHAGGVRRAARTHACFLGEPTGHESPCILCHVYAAVARGLRHDALLHADLHQFARREVDLNMDGALSRYEVLFGLARLVRPEVWNEKLLEQLWRWEPTVA